MHASLLLLALTVARAEEGCAACPVRLLEVVEGEVAKLELNEEGLSYLERQRSPLYLVPALGVYRGGKSMLLNRLMQRTAPYADSFGIGHGQETYTRGIEICAEPLEHGTVVWMDTEGLRLGAVAHSKPINFLHFP